MSTLTHVKMHICYILCIVHEIHSSTLVPGGVVSSASLIGRAGLRIHSLGTQLLDAA